MAMGARIPMLTNAQLLTLAQWFSPAYPVGAFNFSHGLEKAVEDGQVKDAPDLQRWLLTVLEHGTGRSDALFAAAAYHAPTAVELADINAQACAFAPCAERLKESQLQGAAFCKITDRIWAMMPLDLCFPVAVGWAAQRNDLPLVPTISLYLQAFVGNLAAAGQRLAPIGQTDAQALIKTLGPTCEAIAQDSQNGDLTLLSSTTFLADIASMRHETQYARIFQT
ncbi:urease accessory protein UreF [Algirhabdus cladophorae]|uniref:urease accessory protein UreF n=1 Tax=Algirhabdus cladophorae TaxID=3377108 RepID=UPI003B84A686